MPTLTAKRIAAFAGASGLVTSAIVGGVVASTQEPLCTMDDAGGSCVGHLIGFGLLAIGAIPVALAIIWWRAGLSRPGVCAALSVVLMIGCGALFAGSGRWAAGSVPGSTLVAGPSPVALQILLAATVGPALSAALLGHRWRLAGMALLLGLVVAVIGTWLAGAVALRLAG